MSSVAVGVPQVDHRVGERVECVVNLTDALEPEQQAADLVFAGEDPLDGAQAVVENSRIEQRRLATALSDRLGG